MEIIVHLFLFFINCIFLLVLGWFLFFNKRKIITVNFLKPFIIFYLALIVNLPSFNEIIGVFLFFINIFYLVALLIYLLLDQKSELILINFFLKKIKMFYIFHILFIIFYFYLLTKQMLM